MKRFFTFLLCSMLGLALILSANAESGLPSAGDTVTLGVYEQDANEENGPEPLEWLVLDVHDGAALLVSVYGLDSKPYVTGSSRTAWDTSDMRSWLNGEFLDTVFTPEEKERVLLTAVPNDETQSHPKINIRSCDDTEDYVFLLSYAEVMKYFPEKESRICMPTEYAIASGVWPNINKGYCEWLLRTPGQPGRIAIVVTDMADFDVMYIAVDNTQNAVRPALWYRFAP